MREVSFGAIPFIIIAASNRTEKIQASFNELEMLWHPEFKQFTASGLQTIRHISMLNTGCNSNYKNIPKMS
jgi:hypothetical protein